MNRPLWIIGIFLGLTASALGQDKLPKPLVSGLNNPVSVAVGPDGRLYVTEMGEVNKDGDGRIMVIVKDKAVPFATGLDDPKGLVAFGNSLFVTDKKRVWRIDSKGKARVFAAEKAFPSPLLHLHAITVDEQGILYVSDTGNLNLDPFAKSGEGAIYGAIYRINPKGKVSLVTKTRPMPLVKFPTALVMDGMSHLLAVDLASEDLLRIKVADGSATKVVGGPDLDKAFAFGMAWDKHGRLFISDAKNGKVFVIPRPGRQPVLLAGGFQQPGCICLDPTAKFILVPDYKAGTVTAIRATVPGEEVDETPMPLKTAVAFPNLKWTGWKGLSDAGKVAPLRPLVLTHAGDGSNRVFVATQHGIIHVFPNDPKADKTKIFLDIQKRVRYDDNENEEGFLGLAFHPDYKKTGEFFVFYTLKKPARTNVLSRFRVSKDDPDRADPASEEVLLRIQRPFWNHDGGTICFGPDGYLYVALGDGGSANDPFKNGQNLKTLLAKVLRIDVNKKDPGKNYAIPKDNPFVGKKDALPEIWAYGLRNIWRMAFDRKTGKLWASDVGQNLYEEIDIIEKGGNYGWSLREGLHPFSPIGVGPNKNMIEPIWEYHHDVGKSLTGGTVYRGKNLPEFDGYYVYGDYVTAKIWALRYDESKKRVVANRPIPDPNVPILSFGEDERGEVYFMTTTVTGKGIYQFVKAGK